MKIKPYSVARDLRQPIMNVTPHDNKSFSQTITTTNPFNRADYLTWLEQYHKNKE